MSDDSDRLYADDTKGAEESKTVYSQRGDSADEIDPRKLVRDHTLSELRWYYRNTFAKKLVDKPIEDAFKNDFEIDGAGASRARRLMDKVNYIENYQLAEKKARRDGFALLFIGTKESVQGRDSGVHQSPFDEEVEVTDISHVNVLTMDDLCECGPNELMEQVNVSYPDMDAQDLDVRETGLVVNIDVNSEHYKEPIGYALDQRGGPIFIHKDRVQHLVWNPEVDGDFQRGEHLRDQTLGRFEGDSVLIPSYQLLKGLTKGNWALMQAIYRNAANMYVVHLPADANEDDLNAADREFTNMNAKSEFIVPGGPPGSSPDSYQVEQYTSGDLLEPGQHYEVIFDQVCASNEMTKSVLFGTQSGTVSGSETDIKNYFNKVERYRRNRAESKIREFTSRAANIKDGRTTEGFELEYEFDWGPLFRVSQKDRVAMIQSMIQGLTNAINGYVITPDEARSILEESWSEFEGLGTLTEAQKDELDRIQLYQVGQGQFAQIQEAEIGEWQGNGEPGSQQSNLPGNNGGGMEQGQQTSEFTDEWTKEQMQKPTEYEEV